MKIVHINIDDSKGGASIACKAINKAINSSGVESNVLVQMKYISDNETIGFVNNTLRKISYLVRFFLDYFSIFFFTLKNKGRFSFPFFGTDVSKHPLVLEADIINLHWINGGFFSLNTIRKLATLNKPIVWTLHDMWAFTGGCHYSGGCEKYKKLCLECPSLKYRGINDFSNKIFNKKLEVYKNLNLFIVTCSEWLASCAKESRLLKARDIRAIPNPIDINTFKMSDKMESRKIFNLSDNKFLILFGTMNLKEERKGFVFLRDSLLYLYENFPELRSKVELLVFGSFGKDQTINIPFKTNFLGRIGDQKRLVACYNSADVFVAPSLEDNLPNTVMESLSCGVPVVAFNIGGMPDMIEHKNNGFLAEPDSAASLAEGIIWVMNEKNIEQVKLNARRKVLENFTPQIIGERYKNYYSSLLDG